MEISEVPAGLDDHQLSIVAQDVWEVGWDLENVGIEALRLQLGQLVSRDESQHVHVRQELATLLRCAQEETTPESDIAVGDVVQQRCSFREFWPRLGPDPLRSFEPSDGSASESSMVSVFTDGMNCLEPVDCHSKVNLDGQFQIKLYGESSFQRFVQSDVETTGTGALRSKKSGYDIPCQWSTTVCAQTQTTPPTNDGKEKELCIEFDVTFEKDSCLTGLHTELDALQSELKKRGDADEDEISKLREELRAELNTQLEREREREKEKELRDELRAELNAELERERERERREEKENELRDELRAELHAELLAELHQARTREEAKESTNQEELAVITERSHSSEISELRELAAANASSAACEISALRAELAAANVCTSAIRGSVAKACVVEIFKVSEPRAELAASAKTHEHEISELQTELGSSRCREEAHKKEHMRMTCAYLLATAKEYRRIEHDDCQLTDARSQESSGELRSQESGSELTENFEDFLDEGLFWTCETLEQKLKSEVSEAEKFKEELQRERDRTSELNAELLSVQAKGLTKIDDTQAPLLQSLREEREACLRTEELLEAANRELIKYRSNCEAVEEREAACAQLENMLEAANRELSKYRSNCEAAEEREAACAQLENMLEAANRELSKYRSNCEAAEERAAACAQLENKLEAATREMSKYRSTCEAAEEREAAYAQLENKFVEQQRLAAKQGSYDERLEEQQQHFNDRVRSYEDRLLEQQQHAEQRLRSYEGRYAEQQRIHEERLQSYDEKIAAQQRLIVEQADYLVYQRLKLDDYQMEHDRLRKEIQELMDAKWEHSELSETQKGLAGRYLQGRIRPSSLRRINAWEPFAETVALHGENLEAFLTRKESSTLQKDSAQMGSPGSSRLHSTEARKDSAQQEPSLTRTDSVGKVSFRQEPSLTRKDSSRQEPSSSKMQRGDVQRRSTDSLMALVTPIGPHLVTVPEEERETSSNLQRKSAAVTRISLRDARAWVP